MTNPLQHFAYVPEPSLPPLSPVTTPSFVPGVSETYFYYQLDSDGSIARGSRVVTTALDGTQTVQVLDAADAPLVAGSYEVVPAPEVVLMAGGSVSSGGGGTTNGLTDAQLRAAPVPVLGPLTDTQLRAAPVPVTIAGAAPAIVRTPTILSTTTTGTVAAGATSVGFSNEGTVAATVAGGTLPAGRTVSFIAPDGDTLAAIAYTATGTTLVVASVR